MLLALGQDDSDAVQLPKTSIRLLFDLTQNLPDYHHIPRESRSALGGIRGIEHP